MLRLKTILQYDYFYIILFFLILIITFVRLNININSKYNINDTSFVGTLVEYKIDGDKLSFVIKGKEKLKCTYYIKSEEEKDKLLKLELGISLKLEGTLSEPKENTIPNTFNYKKYLNNNGINFTLSVENYKVINKKTNILYSIKNHLINYIDNFKSKGYLNTFIIGNKNYLNEGIYEQYQSLGVSHIFAISGMHISLLSAIILKLLKRFKVRESIAYIAVIIFLIFYIFITNFQASILRSVGLFTLLFINHQLKLEIEVKNILILDICILLLINPFLLNNIGFLYSSVVSFSLINFGYLIKGNYFNQLFRVSILAFLVSLPITLANNYEFNLLSILNNLIIVPFVSLFLYPLSLITLILPPLDNLLLMVTNLFEVIANKLLILNIMIPKINIFFYLIYYILLYCFFKSFNKKYLLLIIMLLIITKYLNYFDFNYYVYMLDVNQGDSLVIKYKDDCILIDTGGQMSYEKEDWQVSKKYQLTDNTMTFLKSIGVYNIDYLVLTHGDYDHMGESEYLVNNFKVNNTIFNGDTYNELEKSLIKLLNKKKIKYYQGLKELKIGKNKLEFLNTKIYDNENDNSNVIYFNYKTFQFLFMGDAGEVKEKDILNQYNIHNIDFLKVGHHGSDTSSSKFFINSINPKYSLISVGKNNRYGHPKDKVLNTLKNSKVYRTDKDGSIEIKLNNNGYKINTYKP